MSFIQKERYLSRFIDLLSQLILPLQQLTNQNTFSWDGASERCFKEVKEVLSSLPSIAPSKWEQLFFGNVGEDTLGSLLMQKDEKLSFMQPIYFASKIMTGAKKGYNNSKRLVLALMFTVTKFWSYLLPRKFIILTLEETFPTLLQHMDGSPRIAKWLLKLQEFEYTIQVENSTRASLAGLLTHRPFE